MTTSPTLPRTFSERCNYVICNRGENKSPLLAGSREVVANTLLKKTRACIGGRQGSMISLCLYVIDAVMSCLETKSVGVRHAAQNLGLKVSGANVLVKLEMLMPESIVRLKTAAIDHQSIQLNYEKRSALNVERLRTYNYATLSRFGLVANISGRSRYADRIIASSIIS